MTAKELAKILGLSPSAVSLALNDRPGVSDQTRKLVKAEAKKQGYRQKPSAHPAAEESIRSIRYVIFLDSGMAVKETSFYSFVLRGIESEAKRHGYNVLVSYFSAQEDWTEQARLLGMDVCGIILLATELQEDHFRRILTNQTICRQWSEIPVVLVDNSAALLDLDSVKSDNFCGARAAANTLFDRGFADVGYLRSTTRIASFVEREAGLQISRRDHGIGPDKALSVIDVASSADQAKVDMDAFLDGGGEPVRAYFADNDIIAAACIRSLKDHGFRVPEDVSVIGFDDMPLCTLFDPPLTTIGIKKTTIGKIAMHLLLERIQAGQSALGPKGPDACLKITLSTKLIERGSVIS